MKDTPAPNRPLIAVALVGGALAGALGGGLVATASTLMRPAASAPAGEAAVRRNTEAPAALGPRLDAIETRLIALELAPPNVGVLPAGRIEQSTSIAESRLVEIEAVLTKLAAAEARREEDVAEQVLRREMRDQERKERAVTARTTILDVTASEDLKLKAWRELRRVAPWGDDIVNEMVRIGETSEDEAVRADVWRQADGKDRNVLLVRPMLSALANDPSERVRSEAAETLQNYKAEPGVVPALRHAAENDSSEEVRQEAQSSLNQG